MIDKNSKQYRINFLNLRSYFGTDKERTKALRNENDLEVLKKANELIKTDANLLYFNRNKRLNFAARIEWKIKYLENHQNQT